MGVPAAAIRCVYDWDVGLAYVCKRLTEVVYASNVGECLAKDAVGNDDCTDA